MPGNAVELRVGPSDAGSRLDRFLIARLTGATRAAVKRLIDDGHVSVGGRRQAKGSAVVDGQLVVVEGYHEPGSWGPEPDPDLRVDIIFQDEDMVVIDKPPGVPCHPLRPGEKGTAAGALVVQFPELAGVGGSRREAGLVHRLDTTTSGVLVFARNQRAFQHLVAELRRGRGEKRYITLVEGTPAATPTIALPLANRGRRVVVARPKEGRSAVGEAQEAVTSVRSAEEIPPFSLLGVSLKAGRRHQIRVHMSAIGHPIAGDSFYGATIETGLDRPFLHASEVELVHPRGGEPVILSAPLAPDLAQCLAHLRGHSQ